MDDVAIITLHSKEMNDVAALTLPNKRNYALKHGIDFFVFPEQLTSLSRPFSWSKIPAIQSILKNYGYVMWMDCDAVFARDDVSILDFCYGEDLHFCVNQDGINAGVFFIRNCWQSHRFLEEVWAATEEEILHPWWEQNRMNLVLKEWFTIQHDFEIVRKHSRMIMDYSGNRQFSMRYYMTKQFNAFRDGEFKYEKGDFIAHAAGMSNEERVVWLKKVLSE